jgi:hypothetical protein
MISDLELGGVEEHASVSQETPSAKFSVVKSRKREQNYPLVAAAVVIHHSR